ncbi:MAG: WYL domain-containing protein [Planctomycetes bacterium]|nr:WYL domain-containing protein [Planctomycetota bacterium]
MVDVSARKGWMMGRGNALLRQWELIKVVQGYHYGISTEDLAKRLEYDKRTVQRDLKVLQGFFPITYETREHGKRFWRLKGDMFQSGGLELTLTEMLSLFLSQQLLLPLSGTQFGDGLQTAMRKIKTQFSEQALRHFDGLDKAFLIKNLAYHDYTDLDREIGILNIATLDQKVLRVTYRSASRGEDVTSEFHPYGMVLLHSSLYCVGYLKCYDHVRTLKVARIQKLTQLKKTFERPATFSLARHFQGAFGIFQAEERQTIRVEFTGWAATNVREIRWHTSQEILSDKAGTVTARFDLDNTVEFKRWILGFGQYARVVSPKEFAEEVRGDLEQALGRY